jgi:Stage II sporulation protein M
MISILHFNIKRRLLYLTLGAVAFIISYSIGAATDMSKNETEYLRQQFDERIKDIDQHGIFFNNLMISLFMFIPAVGIGVGIFSGFSTGLVFSAIAEGSTLLNNISPLVILITPFGILEVFAYGLAISRSGMLIYHIYQLIKKKSLTEYIVPTIIEIGIVIVVLLIGAIIEWQMITQFNEVSNVSIAYL